MDSELSPGTAPTPNGWCHINSVISSVVFSLDLIFRGVFFRVGYGGYDDGVGTPLASEVVRR